MTIQHVFVKIRQTFPPSKFYAIRYINDLPQSVKDSFVLLFADVVKDFRQISSPIDSVLLQGDLHHLEGWKEAWSFKLNIKKSLAVRFSAIPLTF